jgi:hypothetical protein
MKDYAPRVQRTWRRAILTACTLMALSACSLADSEVDEQADGAAATGRRGATTVRRGVPMSAKKKKVVPFTRPPAMPRVGEGQLLVGPKGLDEHGYPYQRPDQLALRSLLRQGRFAELDAQLLAFVADAEKDVHREFWPHDAFEAFSVSDTSLTSKLESWATAAPDSWPRRLVSVKLRAAAAEAAGEAGKTKFAELGTELDGLIEANPKLVVVHASKLGLASELGLDAEQRKSLLEAQLAACPKCYLPHRLYLEGLDNGEELAAYVASLDKLKRPNSRLRLLSTFSKLHECRVATDAGDYNKADALCTEAFDKKHEDLRLQATRGHIALKRTRLDKAGRMLDAVLQRWPQNSGAVEDRYWVHKAQEEHAGAIRTLLQWRRLEPSAKEALPEVDAYSAYLMAEAKTALDQGDLVAASKRVELAYQLDPHKREHITLRGRILFEVGLAPLEAAVAKDPADLEAVLALVAALSHDGKYAAAGPKLSAYIERDPVNGRALFERGLILRQRKIDWTAKNDIEKACELGYAPACSHAD